MIESAARLAYDLVLELFLASALFWVVTILAIRVFRVSDAAWRVRFFVLPVLVPVPLIPLMHLVIRPLGVPSTHLESLLASIVGSFPLVAFIFLGISGLALSLAAVHALRPLAIASRHRRAWRRQQPSSLWLRCDQALQSLASRLQIPPARLILSRGVKCSSFALGPPLSPFVSYVIAPRVLVSALDDEELEALLAHELGHIRRKDTLLGIAVGICRRLMAFSPFAQLSFLSFIRAREEAVDDLAVRAGGCPLALASCLVKACRLSQDRGHYALGVGLLPPASNLDDRIRRLLHYSSGTPERPRSYRWAFMGAIAAGVVVSLLTL